MSRGIFIGIKESGEFGEIQVYPFTEEAKRELGPLIQLLIIFF
jgi:hypothetical protein